MIKARLGKKSQIVLPKTIVDQLHIEEGTEFEVDIVDGRIVMEPMITIPRSQAWFWTERWQRADQEAEEDVHAGRMHTIHNKSDLDDYLARLGVQED